MLGPNDFVGGRALRIQALIEPKQDRADLRVQITKTLDKLHRERSVLGLVLKLAQGGRGRDQFPATGAEKTVCEKIRLIPRASAAHHNLRQSAEIFHQHDAKSDGYRPKLP